MNYEQWREWWTNIAPEYFTDKIWRFSAPELIKRLDIKKSDFVLELGFGYGRETSQFCTLSDYVYGLELTQWACNNTLRELSEREISPLPILHPYDGQTIPFPIGYFDVIYSCFVLQHLSREHVKNLIREALRVLSIGGKVLFEFFGDPEYYNDGVDVFSGIDGQGGMFNNAFVQEELTAFIEDCGGVVHWIEPWKITNQWGNHWVCFGRSE